MSGLSVPLKYFENFDSKMFDNLGEFDIKARYTLGRSCCRKVRTVTALQSFYSFNVSLASENAFSLKFHAT